MLAVPPEEDGAVFLVQMMKETIDLGMDALRDLARQDRAREKENVSSSRRFSL